MFKEFQCDNGHFIIHKNLMYKIMPYDEIKLGDYAYNNDGHVFTVDEEDDLDQLNDCYYKVQKL